LLVSVAVVLATGGGPATAGPPVNQCGTTRYCTTLTIEAGSYLGPGSGSITSVPEGIACTVAAAAQSGTCSFQFSWPIFADAPSVTLTATPAAGSLVAAASSPVVSTGGAAPSTQPLTYLIRTLAPGGSFVVRPFTFSLAAYTLRVATSGPGGGRVEATQYGIACGTDCSTSLPYGSSLPLTAVPDTGSVFARWDGACAGQGASCTVTIARDDTATAVFDKASGGGPPPPPPPPPPPQPPTKPPAGTHPPVASVVPGVSKTLPRAIWLNAAGSTPSSTARIVRYDWDVNDDGRFDLPCGVGLSAMSTTFLHAGPQTVRLRVTDSAGRVATATQRVLVPASAVSRVGGRLGTVADCENPGGDNQPDRADCVKTFAFGLVQVNSRGKPEDCFTLQAIVSQRIVGKGHRAAAVLASTRLFRYHATIKGPVSLNGIYLPLPESVKTEYDSQKRTLGLGHVRPQVGPYKLPGADLSLTVTPNAGGTFRLFDQSMPSAVRKAVAGLPLRSVQIDLVPGGGSDTSFNVALPNIFTFPGEPEILGRVVLHADNATGVELDGMRLGPVPLVYIGPLAVRDLFFEWSARKQTWAGGAELPLFEGSPYALRAAPPPPDAGFAVRNGRFVHAGAALDIPLPPYPEVFPGVGLKRIGIAIGVHPTRFTGDVSAVLAQGLVDVDGEVTAIFATPDVPYLVPDEGLGASLAPLAGRLLTTTSLAVGGNLKLRVPVVKELQLASAHVFYSYPDYVEFGGDVSFDEEYFSIKGGASGFVALGPKTFDLEGGITACLKEVIDKCFDAGAVVSTKGIAYCGVIPLPTPFGIVLAPGGIGYRWGDTLPDIMLFSCDRGPYRESRPASTLALASLAAPFAGTSFTLPAGLPSALVRVSGSGGAPLLTLTGPKGEHIVTSGTGSGGRDFYVLPFPKQHVTLVALRRPAAGRWTVTARPGSPAITTVATAAGLPEAQVTGVVTGRGRSFTLAYRTVPATGQVVTFVERAGVNRVLGRARGTKGTLRFSETGTSGGKRRIVALVSRNGLPTRSLTIASFTVRRAPPPAAPRRLRAVARGSALRVSWRRVPGAARYAVSLRLADGQRLARITHTPRASFARLGTRPRGRVTVLALRADGVHGRTAAVSITRR